MTNSARITERFRRVNFGRLEIEAHGRRPEGIHCAMDNHAGISFYVPDTELLDYSLYSRTKRTCRISWANSEVTIFCLVGAGTVSGCEETQS